MPKSIQIATYNNTRIHKIFIKGKANGISFTSATFKLTCNIFSFFFLAYTHSKNKSNHSDILIINYILRSLYAIILRLFFSRTQQQYLDTSYSMDISFTFDFTSNGCQQKQTFLAHTHEIYEVQVKHLRVGFDSTEDNAVVRNIQIKFQIQYQLKVNSKM